MEKEKMIQLVTAAQAGNQQAISDLFNAYHTDVYNIALRETKSPDTAADVMQESFIEVIQTIGKLQEPAAFMSWLKAITYHQCTRYYRKKENKHEQLLAETEDTLTVFDSLEEENTEFIPDMALENAELGRTIRGFVEDLPDSQRAAIMMKYYDELSVKEIAAVQGVSENTVLSRLYYGRNAIKGEVEAYEKKHNVKLHAIPFLPLLRGAFSEAPKRMAAKTTVAAAKAISTATGVKVTATGVGIAGTVAALPLATKIGAGIAAAVIAVVAIGIGPGKTSVQKDKTDSTVADTDLTNKNENEETPLAIFDPKTQMTIVDPFWMIESVYAAENGKDFVIPIQGSWFNKLETHEDVYYIENITDNSFSILSENTFMMDNSMYKKWSAFKIVSATENLIENGEIELTVNVEENEFAKCGIILTPLTKTYPAKTYTYLEDADRISKDELQKLIDLAVLSAEQKGLPFDFISAHLYVNHSVSHVTPSILMIFKENDTYRIAALDDIIYGSDGTINTLAIPRLSISSFFDNKTTFSSEEEIIEMFESFVNWCAGDITIDRINF